jgi:hypothetical protein
MGVLLLLLRGGSQLPGGMGWTNGGVVGRLEQTPDTLRQTIDTGTAAATATAQQRASTAQIYHIHPALHHTAAVLPSFEVRIALAAGTMVWLGSQPLRRPPLV